MFKSKKNATMAELVKTVQEKEELEKQLKNAHSRIRELETDLTSAKGKVGELETKLKDTDLAALKEKAKQSAAEYDALKKLYAGKVRAFDSSVETREEEFARESAVKRHNLEEEIRTNREGAQEQVSNTVQDFAGSYLYYMDQIRMMMEALSQAAAETGKTLFTGEAGNIKERFGASIAERIRNDVGALEQGTGDRVLISAAEEVKEEKEDAEEADPEEEPEEESEEEPETEPEPEAEPEDGEEPDEPEAEEPEADA